MKNLAGRPSATAVAMDELTLAGIAVIPSPRPDGETKAAVDGELRAGRYVFRFNRAWAYWRVSCSPELPVDMLLHLNATPFQGEGTRYSGRPGTLGAVARAHGYAGGMKEEQIHKRGPCDSWHVDSSEALKAFVEWCVATLGTPAGAAAARTVKTCGCVAPHPHRAGVMVAKPWCSTCGGAGVKP